MRHPGLKLNIPPRCFVCAGALTLSFGEYYRLLWAFGMHNSRSFSAADLRCAARPVTLGCSMLSVSPRGERKVSAPAHVKHLVVTVRCAAPRNSSPGTRPRNSMSGHQSMQTT